MKKLFKRIKRRARKPVITDEWKDFKDALLHDQIEQGIAPRYRRPCPPPPPPRWSRPCEVDGQPCTFHRWAEEDRVLLWFDSPPEDSEKMYQRIKGDCVLGPGCSHEVIRRTYALVEYPDGTAHLVEPDRVKFTDKEEPTDD